MSEELTGVPHLLTVTNVGTSYANPVGMKFDFNIGGIWFFSAASREFPYRRKLADVQKEQFDNSDNPGDNSLQGWWMRTQTDWSAGAGQPIMEPVGQDGVDRAYDSSAGVDTMNDPGWIRCLPLPEEQDTWSSSAAPVIVSIPDGYVVASGTEVTRVVSGVPSTATAAGTVTSLVVAGPNVLVISSGKIEWAPLTGSFTLSTGFTCTGTPRAWWIKSRILIAFGDEIHENPGATISGLTDLDAATPQYDLGDSTVDIVGATGTPASILLAVNSSTGAQIMALTLDTDGSLPTTTAPVVVAEFPSGETLYDISSYLGAFVGISSSRGIRVATVTSSGGITYGPLASAPVASVADHTFSAFDRFLHYPVEDAGDGRGGLVRIDLSEIDRDGRPAWTTFIRVPTEVPAYGGVVTGARSAYIVTHSGTTNALWYADDDSDLDTGWLQGSTVRYGTLETKQFDSVKIIAEKPMVGTLLVQAVNEGQAASNLGSLGAASGSSANLYTGNRSAVTGMAVRVTLTPDGAEGPGVAAWTIRAVPMIENRGETVVLPMLNFDKERSSTGTPFGYEGRAYERWMALRHRIGTGLPVVVTEGGSGASYVAHVEDMSFVQVDPPVNASGFGGIILLQLKAR